MGNFYRSARNQNRANALKWIQKLPVQGVELTLGNQKDFEAFHLNTQQKKYLLDLDYVSLHAPFKTLAYYPTTETLDNALNKIQEIYDESNAKAIVFHPHHLPPHQLLRKRHFKVLIENMEQKKHIPTSRITRLADEYHAGYCLDTSHAYEFGSHETQKLFHKFKQRLGQIHLSANYRHQNHQQLTKASPAFLQSLEPLQETDVPIVIEEDFKRRNLTLAKKEIDWIRTFFR